MPTTRIPYGVLDGRYVNAAGDTMLGELILAGAPTSDLHAATKKYVDDAVGVGGHTHTLSAGATDVTAIAAEVNLLDLSGLSIGQVLRATGAASAAWGGIQAGDLPTGIDAAKISDGSVSNAEYQYLNGVTSAIQTQLDAKAADSIVLKKDGSVALTANWDIGDTRKILADGIRARDAAGLELYDDGNNGIFIEDGGNVGIGTTGPDRRLDVLDSSSPQLRLTHTDGTKFADFQVDTNHDLKIKPSSTGQIILQPTTDAADFFQVLDADGGVPILNVDAINERIGIGTAQPPAAFTIKLPNGTISAGSSFPFRCIGGSGDNVGMIFERSDASRHICMFTGSAGAALKFTDTLARLAIGSEPYTSRLGTGYPTTEAISILSNGNVGIGTTDPSQALEVAGNAVIGTHDNYHKLYVSRYSSASYAYLVAGDTDRDTAVGFAVQYRDINGSLTTGLVIDIGGRVGIATTQPGRKMDIIDPSASQLRLTQLTDTNYVDFLANANGDLTITPSGSKVLLAKALEVDGAFDHDGSTFGVFGVTPASRVAAYTVTNAITDRSFDADNTTVAELADVVATIIDDLKTYGFFQ